MLHAEAYCLEIGRRCGLTTFASDVRYFDGSPALVIERYDRSVDAAGTVHRIHQEDAAQALGLPWGGDAKYESFPPFRATLANIAGLLRRRRTVLGGGEDDRERLLAFMALHVAVGNTDAHAKNFSLLHLPNGQIELAPLYDVLPQVLTPDGRQNLAIGVNGVRFRPSVTMADLAAEGQSWGLPQDRADAVLKDTLEQVRYAIEEIDTAGVAANAPPLLVANQARNLLNGKAAAVSSGGPVALEHGQPVSAMPRNHAPRAGQNQP
ncbi:HipA domain-containing protein [Arthrobacter sp. PAMC 25486]|uniref:HipA domain-containing protein n=1 Tax=Arthrobacter sp. PAMC 25486 TaxID=1494608 RepID=UPI00069179AB|nr:HipA domain-containing protein [Arthrobacter sp. PAMC 25486]